MKTEMKSLIFSILCISFCLDYTSGDCVMRRHCGKDDLTEIPKPCKYDGKPVPLTDQTVLDYLKDSCPRLQLDYGSSACCDADQVSMLENNIMVLASILKRCPSCFYNLANLFCQLICSPHQSDFLQVTDTSKMPDSTESVNELNYFISEKYVNGLYQSCENVKLGDTQNPAMDIFCGPYGNDCSPRRWLKWLGSHDPSPFQINFQIEDTSEIHRNGRLLFPMNSSLTLCSEPAIAGGLPCDQNDCPSKQ